MPVSVYEIVAAILYSSWFALAIIAISLCVFLYRHARNPGWLLLTVLFLEPFRDLMVRLAHHRPLLTHRVTGPEPDGLPTITYTYDIPTLYILAVAGLLLLAREANRKAKPLQPVA